MSVQIMSLVWEHGPTEHAQFIVLLALADFANASGECWPGVKSIALRVRLGERSTIRSLKSLEHDGWIAVMRKSRDHKGNSYRVTVERFKSDATVSPDFDFSHATMSPETEWSAATVSPDSQKVTCQPVPSQVTNTTKSGDKSAKPPDPLKGRTTKNHQEPPRRTQAFVLPGWIPREKWDAFLEMRRKQGATPTLYAIRGLVARLERFMKSGHDPGEVLDESTMSNWKNVYELKTGGNNGRTRFNRAQTNVDSTITGARAALASLGVDCGPPGNAGNDDGRADGYPGSPVTIDGRKPRRLT